MNSIKNTTGNTWLGLARLYRIDSFIVTIFSFFVTLFIIHGPVLEPKAWILGLSLGLVFVNFVYSLNSYYDSDIDAINKPFRPIPSGAVAKETAMRYIAFLGLLSFLLPLGFINNPKLFYALYAFPAIAILYSNPVYPLKKIAPLATLLTALLLVLPATMALLFSQSFEQHWYYALVIFCYCFFLVPLKDIEDVKGDVAHNSGNWAHIAGDRNLLLFSIAGLSSLAAATFVFRETPGLIYLFGVFLAIIAVQLYFLFFRKPLNTIYKTIILSNIILLITGFIGFVIKTSFL